jgi:hypothetical protein
LSQNYFNVERCFFRFVSFHACFYSRHHSNEWWKSKANHHTICINWISWIWIQFELHAMSFSIFNQIELSFHKMNSFIHHFIINSNAKQCGAQVELHSVQMFYEYVVFWYHFRKTCLSFYVVEKCSTLYIIYDDFVCMRYTWEHIYANYVKILLSNCFVY